MSVLVYEVIRLVLGIGFGLLAIAFVISTFRLMTFGQDAYRSNQRLTPKNVLAVWRGALRDDVEDFDGRASHGVALNIRTGTLEQQRRLSTEAIDDVIGRPAA